MDDVAAARSAFALARERECCLVAAGVRGEELNKATRARVEARVELAAALLRYAAAAAGEQPGMTADRATRSQE